MLDDRAAVQQAQRGDDHAWRELYERHVDLVFRLACRVVRDRDAALDVVQDAFVKASRSIDGFRGDASFKSWIAAITLNEARSWLRKKGRERQVSLDSVAEPEATDRGPEDRASDRQLAERALEYIRTLPDQQRDAVLLRTTEGLSYREIAAIVGSSEGSVRVSFHHGMTKLREHMRRIDGPTLAGGAGRT